MNYPDPSRIIYPSAGPPRLVCHLTTRDKAKLYPVHEHDAFIDRHGNGVTTATASHFHRIVNGRVLADQSDGHTHRLTRLPCGAGG